LRPPAGKPPARSSAATVAIHVARASAASAPTHTRTVRQRLARERRPMWLPGCSSMTCRLYQGFPQALPGGRVLGVRAAIGARAGKRRRGSAARGLSPAAPPPMPVIARMFYLSDGGASSRLVEPELPGAVRERARLGAGEDHCELGAVGVCPGAGGSDRRTGGACGRLLRGEGLPVGVVPAAARAAGLGPLAPMSAAVWLCHAYRPRVPLYRRHAITCMRCPMRTARTRQRPGARRRSHDHR
jgi:hypothetical protein